MRILLDTHIFLWMVADRRRIGPQLRANLEDAANDVVFSAVLSWEITAKRASGKLAFSGSPLAVARRTGLTELDVTAAHCELAGDLEQHHRDPFDRLLIAQAQSEGLILATADSALLQYGVPILRNN